MDVKDRVRKRIDHWPPHQSHESGQAHESDVPRLQLMHQLAVEVVAFGPPAVTHRDGLDAGVPGEVERSCVRPVRDDHCDRRVQLPSGNGINVRLINTSEVRVSVVVDAKHGEEAIKRLESTFDKSAKTHASS